MIILLVCVETMDIEKYLVHHSDFFEGSEVFVQFKPDILFQLIQFLMDFLHIQIGILVFIDEDDAFQQIIPPVFTPTLQTDPDTVKLDLMDDVLYAVLKSESIIIMFPEILQNGN